MTAHPARSVTAHSPGNRTDVIRESIGVRKRGGQQGVEAFSSRCFRMFMRGKNTVEIAKHLNCTESKVYFHLSQANEASYQRSLTLPKFKNARQDAEATPASARRAAETNKSLLPPPRPISHQEA